MVGGEGEEEEQEGAEEAVLPQGGQQEEKGEEEGGAVEGRTGGQAHCVLGREVGEDWGER